MNIKFIAERINKNYESDNSIGRSKSCNKDFYSDRNINEILEKEKNKNNIKRYLIDKSHYENLDNNEIKEIKNSNQNQPKVSKIESLETLKSEKNKNAKSRYKNDDDSIENYNYLRYGENISENSENYKPKNINNIQNNSKNQNNNVRTNRRIDIDSESELNDLKNNRNKNNNNSIYEYDKDSTNNIITNLSENFINSNNYNDFLEDFKKLKSKYKKLKQLYKNELEACLHWKNSYYNLLKNSLCFDDTIKTLIEENRIHQEYIINLEKKNQKLLQTCTNITNDFHNNFFLNMNNLTLGNNNSNNLNSDSLNKLISKNFNELLNDYKKQLDVLSEEKDTLFSNLSLARHQHLQMTLKTEEIQNRIFSLEKLRSDDLIFLEKNVKNNIK